MTRRPSLLQAAREVVEARRACTADTTVEDWAARLSAAHDALEQAVAYVDGSLGGRVQRKVDDIEGMRAHA